MHGSGRGGFLWALPSHTSRIVSSNADLQWMERFSMSHQPQQREDRHSINTTTTTTTDSSLPSPIHNSNEREDEWRQSFISLPRGGARQSRNQHRYYPTAHGGGVNHSSARSSSFLNRKSFWNRVNPKEPSTPTDSARSSLTDKILQTYLDPVTCHHREKESKMGDGGTRSVLDPIEEEGTATAGTTTGVTTGNTSSSSSSHCEMLKHGEREEMAAVKKGGRLRGLIDRIGGTIFKGSEGKEGASGSGGAGSVGSSASESWGNDPKDAKGYGEFTGKGRAPLYTPSVG
ncbi:hypothetical protein HDU98_000861, partial [Podochytrium sp. JEL0797]